MSGMWPTNSFDSAAFKSVARIRFSFDRRSDLERVDCSSVEAEIVLPIAAPFRDNDKKTNSASRWLSMAVKRGRRWRRIKSERVGDIANRRFPARVTEDG